MKWHFCTKGGQLGPRVNDVTSLDQRRSVGAPRESHDVFGASVCLPVCNILSSPPIQQSWAPQARSEALRTPHDWILAVRWRWPCDSNTCNVYIICFIYKGLRYHRSLLSVWGFCWIFLQDIISFVWLVERRWEGFFHGNNCGVGLEAWELARSTLRTVRGWLPPTEEGVKLLAIFSFLLKLAMQQEIDDFFTVI